MLDYVIKPLSWFSDFKDWTIHKLASSLVLRYLDGYKTDIGRILQALTTIIVVVSGWFPEVAFVIGINEQWMAVIALLSNLGLEFGIQHKKFKAKKLLAPHPESLKRKKSDKVFVYVSEDLVKDKLKGQDELQQV